MYSRKTSVEVIRVDGNSADLSGSVEQLPFIFCSFHRFLFDQISFVQSRILNPFNFCDVRKFSPWRRTKCTDWVAVCCDQWEGTSGLDAMVSDVGLGALSEDNL